MILIKDLNVSYGLKSKVLNSLSLSLPEGSIHGIVGLNGSGKTTLLNAIYGLKSIDSGEITCNGGRVSKRDVSYLTTESYLYSNITGREYLGLFNNNVFDADRWNQLFSLPLNQVINSYSTGMRKKLAVLGVLKQDKPIMILDEPFNGLDIEACRVIRTLLLRLKEQGRLIVATSHIIETLTNLCDYIHYLNDGKIMLSKGKDEFAEFTQYLNDHLDTRNSQVIEGIL